MKSILINNLDVAKSQESTGGEFGVSDCSRLLEVIDSASQDKLAIRYQLSGGGAQLNTPSLHLTIDASIPLVCQRCLTALQFDVELAFDYIVSTIEPEDGDAQDDVDWLEASRDMDLVELIEDELLIAIPFAPTHAHDCQPVKMESGGKPNPFAVLKGLIK